MRHVIITSDLESGGFNVEVPSLPGCFSQGDTVEEALANIKEAIEGFELALQDLGESVPQENGPFLVAVV
jgi:predicted RNase H-like HicB family nuclease